MAYCGGTGQCQANSDQQLNQQPDDGAGGDDMDDVLFVAEKGDGGGECDQGSQPVEAGGQALGPKDVVAEEERQIEDNANDRGGDGGKRRGEFEVVVGGFDQRAAEQNEDEGWQESEPGDQCGGNGASQKEAIRTEHGLDVAADKADESDDHDQRAGRGFAEGEAVDHLGRR